MTDQNPAGEPLAGGVQGMPNAGTSPTANESQTSKDSGPTLEDVLKRLDSLEKATQSAKDKAIYEARKDIETLREQNKTLAERLDRYDQLREGGMSHDDAKWRMEVEEMLQERNQQPSTNVESDQGMATQDRTPAVDPQVTIQAAGLDPADPQVTAILNQEGDPTQALLSLAASRKQTPSPDRVMTTGSGSSVPPEPDLWEQYRKEVALHRGNIKVVSEIQAKYARLGLPV